MRGSINVKCIRIVGWIRASIAMEPNMHQTVYRSHVHSATDIMLTSRQPAKGSESMRYTYFFLLIGGIFLLSVGCTNGPQAAAKPMVNSMQGASPQATSSADVNFNTSKPPPYQPGM